MCRNILIISGGLQIGGAERFAANIAKYAPHNEFCFDYLIFDKNATAFADDVTSRGGRIIVIDHPSAGYLKYIKELSDVIKNGNYSVVHSQTQFNSGINLLVAKGKGVPIRIAHSHTTAHENKVSIQQNIYEKLMRVLIGRTATDLCACGIDAGKWEFNNRPFQVINNGINTDAFKFSEENRARMREKYNIPFGARVIGHSGTLSKLKNQEYLIRNLSEDDYLVLVGRGNREQSEYLRNVAQNCGVCERVIFTGGIMNVNEVLSAFDVFAFPSLREGTPLSLIEAQANGLPCVINDSIPKDAVVTDLVEAIPINDEKRWVKALKNKKRNEPQRYADIVAKKGYGIESSLKTLYDIYRRKF